MRHLDAIRKTNRTPKDGIHHLRRFKKAYWVPQSITFAMFADMPLDLYLIFTCVIWLALGDFRHLFTELEDVTAVMITVTLVTYENISDSSNFIIPLTFVIGLASLNVTLLRIEYHAHCMCESTIVAPGRFTACASILLSLSQVRTSSAIGTSNGFGRVYMIRTWFTETHSILYVPVAHALTSSALIIRLHLLTCRTSASLFTCVVTGMLTHKLGLNAHSFVIVGSTVKPARVRSRIGALNNPVQDE